MYLVLKKLRIILNFWRIVPAWLIIKTLKKNFQNEIYHEMEYWRKCNREEAFSKFMLFGLLLLEYKEYRNLICHRIRFMGGGYCRSRVLKAIFPLEKTLFINTVDIGSPFFIQHGFASIISAKKIGSYCWMNQQVTIGWTFASEPPVIGNGVRICAGAVVVGDIEIGDNSIIAANATVVKDVGSNLIVGGTPAKIIGENEEHKLFERVNIYV